MKHSFLIVAIIISITFLSSCTHKLSMQLSSPVFQNNDFLPSKYTCQDLNVNPPLIIKDIPPKAKSLALIVDDPDAPSGTWTHWLVWNIKPDTKEISENSVPKGAVEGITSWDRPGYSGPCPPSGTHRYFFKIFALNTTLDLPPSATVSQLLTAIPKYLLAQAEITGRYSKK